MQTQPEIGIGPVHFGAGGDPTFDAGTTHVVHVPVSNPTPEQFTYTLELFLALTEGGTKVATGSKTFTLAGGASDTVDVGLTMPGAAGGPYGLYGDVFVAGVNILSFYGTDAVGNPITVTVEVALAGILEHDPFGFIWYEGLVGWEWVHTGREIPLNKEISLAPGWVNQSEVSIVGHIDLVVTYPDGTTVTLSAAPDSAQDYEAAPGNGYHVGFEPFISSQAGIYTITATLSSAGQVLDSVTFTLEAIGVGEFTYSNLSCETVRIPGEAYYDQWLHVEVDITNTGSVVATRRIAVWCTVVFASEDYRREVSALACDYGGCPLCKDRSPLELTLNPGETYHYCFCSYRVDPDTVFPVWMEDDMGWVSEKCYG